MYALVNDGVVTKLPYTLSDLRSAYPDVSFPKKMTIEIYESYGVYPVVNQTPSYDSSVQRLIEADPTFDVSVKTVFRNFTVVDIDADELAERVRKKRNVLLSKCDWTMAPDAPVNQDDWISYRSALRAVPEQEEFPHSVVWPTEPES